MIIVVGGIKGGTGKTTLVTNLAVMRANAGKRILLVDSDEQKTACDWAEHRQGKGIATSWPTVSISGGSTHKQIQKMYQNYDDVFVDVGGRETTSQLSAMMVADVFIVPFKPRLFDMFTVGKVRELVARTKKYNPKMRIYAVINQADIRGSDNEEAMELLESCEDFICLNAIRYRKAFGNASADGLGVVEMRAQDKKAVEEMQHLYENVFNT